MRGQFSGREQFTEVDPSSYSNRDKALQAQTPEQILKAAKELYGIDMNNTKKVLKTVSSLSMSEKLSDQAKGMQIARLHEALLKSQQRARAIVYNN